MLFRSVLFGAGKYAIALYIGNSNVASSFGAAGALIVLLLWIFYSSPDFFAGRRVHARVGSGMGQPQSRHATEARTPAKRLSQHTPLQRLDRAVVAMRPVEACPGQQLDVAAIDAGVHALGGADRLQVGRLLPKPKKRSTTVSRLQGSGVTSLRGHEPGKQHALA